MNRKHCLPYGPDVLPPRGWILAHIEGRAGLHWVDPTQLNTFRVRRSRLTPEQVERIRSFKKKLGRQDPFSLKKTLRNFERDQNPEREILIWEHIAEVFEGEMATRPKASRIEEALVYRATLLCSLVGPSVEHLLASEPRLKGLRGLDRITGRYAA